ncbi:MAG: 3-isopropylmalate dehydratase small subunit [Deltaproteobacteria bacterium]|jgi:3-isopropylmalate dehydratase small subunit|nr:MAG: 3-isopropylmalate dehydratase small subunit [Deltaproteobacteria bacterium]
MRFKGRVWKFGSDVDTDAIIPARYLNTSDPEELAKHCMEDADLSFAESVKQGDIIFAGKNFGCGSSREHAPIAIKAAGISCVVAKSFARIFYRNSFNMALPIMECPEAVDVAEAGDEVEIDLDRGEIINHTKQKTFSCQPIPPFMQELVQSGGLMGYVTKKIISSP